jgi:hypothetical protein
MTTYKELFGKYVQNYASDPTSTDAEGQIWYNTTSGTFKTVLGSLWSMGKSGGTYKYGKIKIFHLQALKLLVLHLEEIVFQQCSGVT